MLNDFATASWFVPIVVLVAIAAVALLAFEIVMLISAIQNDKLSSTAKTWWIVGMCFVHPFIALAYYFMVLKGPIRKWGGLSRVHEI
jgi:hypothetical protein